MATPEGPPPARRQTDPENKNHVDGLSVNNASEATAGVSTINQETVLRNRTMFEAMDATEEGTVLVSTIEEALRDSGVSLKDPRLRSTMAYLRKVTRPLSFEEFTQAIAPNRLFIERCLRRQLVIPDWAHFCADLYEIYLAAKGARGGKQAVYIPQLATVDPELYAMSFCSVDGQVFNLGDTDARFSIQSCSKPITYLIALEEHGEDYVHNYVGREPSGRNFNELVLNKDGIPHNPMINSGAIMTVSLIRSGDEQASRFEHILDFFQRLAARRGEVGFSNSIYLSERATADRNFCLSYMMQEAGAFQKGMRAESGAPRYPPRQWDQHSLVKHLELYFQTCAITARSKDMACISATLANGGRCPFTDDRVFSAHNVRNALSLMYSCGMYDFSGQWAFEIGLPAKSGVSGCVMVVIPNVGGLCVYSPRLDALGNSVRAVEFCHRLMRRFNFHLFDKLNGVITSESSQRDPTSRVDTEYQNNAVTLCFLAASGDLKGVKAMVAGGASPDICDYDGRTPLHLAACEGRLPVVKYLVSKCRTLAPVDRWGNTPLDDARREGFADVARFLEKRIAARPGGRGATPSGAPSPTEGGAGAVTPLPATPHLQSANAPASAASAAAQLLLTPSVGARAAQGLQPLEEESKDVH